MHQSKGKTALITGAAGFLGSHLTDRLISEGWHVIGLDNLMSGSLENLPEAFRSNRFEFVEADVIIPYDINADLVVNLACPASPPRYQADPLHTMKTSVMGAFNACEVARKNNARLVHSSTSEIYGDPEIHPQVESYRGAVNPIGIRACYDEGKRAAETIIFDYNRTHGLEIGVCRIFNTYGPRMDPYDGRVVSNFIRQALLGEPLTIYGDGKQTRSFCFVDDLVDGLMRLSLAGPDCVGPINLGNPTELTIMELAEEIRNKIGTQVRIEYKPLPSDDPTRRKPDIAEARSKLGWEPKVMLGDGLDRTIRYFDALIRSDKLADYQIADNARYSMVAG
ncbi:UDP-glucuronic acid decarboxylase family protein [Tateyamaria pelophila]|uniref:UDP-glucuronic acid decarboxylase family protein n=1 Tax=Tateyamaria pelophila TaxID=328415 RepID=UPI001CBE2F79|nr:UDP-glucuronic acid decarboxylase family protein [Tateyamaria pelophila]